MRCRDRGVLEKTSYNGADNGVIKSCVQAVPANRVDAGPSTFRAEGQARSW